MTNASRTGVVLDERRLVLLLRYGNNLLVTRNAGGAVVECVVGGLGEVVPVDLFEVFLSAKWLEDVARGLRYGLSDAGRKRLR
jgi:hypothetical protein